MLAKTIETGSFAPSGGAAALNDLPRFCRVSVQLKPSADSDIGAEIWLPISGWNGKFLAVGSGGWGGSIAYDDMAEALRRGYATSATDDGHTGRGASFIAGHPEKFIDFAYRAEHGMVLEAKRLIVEFYGRAARYSYWNGCSGGGREGLLQAYRYPDELDGIIAGDPANMRRNAWALWLAIQTFKDPAAVIPPEKYPAIHRAVLDACDANDGLRDGLIDDPASCQVDFKALQCAGADGPDCLTPRQVLTARTITSPATTAAGQVVFPRLEPGTELRWSRLAGGPRPADIFVDQFRYVVYQDPDWDWRSFDLARDSEKANAVDKDIDELDPRLAALQSTAANCSSTMAGPISRWRRAQRSNSTSRFSNRARIPFQVRIGSDCSWCPAWDIAKAERAPTPSTRSAYSSGGSRAGSAGAHRRRPQHRG